jgi:putative transposase
LSFPKWKTVDHVFEHWRNDGIWQKIHDTLCCLVRKNKGKKPTSSIVIIDSPSVMTTESDGDHGNDNAENVNGRKRHILVDPLGLIMAMSFTRRTFRTGTVRNQRSTCSSNAFPA